MAEPTAETFADRLAEWRKSKNLTQEELAEKTGLGTRTISDLERGISTRPRSDTLRRLASALDRTEAELVALTQEKPKIGVHADGQAKAAAEVPMGPSPWPPPARMLPRTIESFTGRDAEVRELIGLAAGEGGHRHIHVVEGMAGIGKTSLVLHVAHRVARHFPDGQLFVDLKAYTEGIEPLTAQQALGLLLLSLGVRPADIPEETQARANLYRDRLSGTRTLIVLDNARSLDQVTPLLPGGRGCVVMVTSRRSLGSLDDARTIALDVLPAADAAMLLRTIAGPGRIRADDPALAEIISQCGGLPLAIRIIASRLGHRGALRATDVAAGLRDEHQRLTRLADGDRSVTAVLALSYQGLSEPEQQLFRYLGLVPGPDFDAFAAASLADIGVAEAERRLDSLLDHNLLIQREAGRYRFHDLVRAYARSVTAVPGRAAARQRLLDYYVSTAQAADRRLDRRLPRISRPAASSRPSAAPEVETPAQAQAWIRAELASLEAAASDAAGGGQPGHAVALSAALAHFLRTHGPWTRAAALHRGAYEAARAGGDPRGEAEALAHLATVQQLAGDFGTAEENLDRALRTFRQLGDGRAEAGVLAELGIVRRITGQYAGAEEAFALARDRYAVLGDRHGQAGVLAELGIVMRQKGKLVQAVETLTRALGHYRELGHRYGAAGTLSYRGSVHATTGAYELAEQDLAEALGLYRELDDRRGLANTHLFLGCVQRDAGAHSAAKQALTTALELYHELGERRGSAGALTFLGVLQTMTGDYPDADRSLTEAIALFRELSDRGGETEALNGHAALTAITGTPAQARAEYETALAVAVEISSRKDEADATAGLAAACRAERNLAAALAYYQRALFLYESLDCAADATRLREILRAWP